MFKYCSPIGDLAIDSNGKAITSIRPWQKCDSATFPAVDCELMAANWLKDYFAGKQVSTLPPLELIGTPFQIMVWRLLLQLPYGATISYGDVAKTICKQTGKESMSAQAVGNALGANKIIILIPCHRVIGARGKLGGFAYGTEMKAKLLEQEKRYIKNSL